MSQIVNSMSDCMDYCRVQRFKQGSGCQYIKATKLCGVTGTCSLSPATTSWAAICTFGHGAELKYAITKGDNGNLWNIDETTGAVYARLPLVIDFENEYTNYFELKIEAADSIGQKSSTILHIRIDDINESPRWANSFRGSVKEVQPTGWQFGDTVKAYDPDFEYIKTQILWWDGRTSSSCVENSNNNIRLAEGCTTGFIEGVIVWKEFGSWEFDFITAPVPGGDVKDYVLFKAKNRFGKWLTMAQQNGKKRRELPVTASISKRFVYRIEFTSSSEESAKHITVIGGENAVARVNQGRYLQFSIIDGNYGGKNGPGKEGINDVFRVNNFNDGTCKLAVNKAAQLHFRNVVAGIRVGAQANVQWFMISSLNIR
jgi:hypothetical protein